jgi:hypothetical protein
MAIDWWHWSQVQRGVTEPPVGWWHWLRYWSPLGRWRRRWWYRACWGWRGLR